MTGQGVPHQNGRIYVAGHRGLVGSAISRRLSSAGCTQLITRSHAELDLTDPAAVEAFFEREKPEAVYLCAAKVGGILANDSYPAEFIQQNLAMEMSVLHSAWRHGVRRLLFLGSSCIYPRECPQPIREDYLLTGPLEPTNRPYAVAKIAGIEMCWSYNRQYGTRFLSAMPTNLYGPGDNYDLETSHVIPALLRKAHEARRAGADHMEVWGTGTPRREFLYSDDLADACVHLLDLPESDFDRLVAPNTLPVVNIGCGRDLSIRELAERICRVVGFEGELRFDTSRPDGTPRKVLDVSRLHASGWRERTDLDDGLRQAYGEFLESIGDSP